MYIHTLLLIIDSLASLAKKEGGGKIVVPIYNIPLTSAKVLQYIMVGLFFRLESHRRAEAVPSFVPIALNYYSVHAGASDAASGIIYCICIHWASDDDELTVLDEDARERC